MKSSATHKYRATVIIALAIFLLFIYKNCSITYAGCPAGVSYSSASCVKLSLDTKQSVECHGYGRWCSFTAPNDGYYKFYGIMTSNNGQYNYVWLNGRLFNDPEENSLNTVGSSDSSNHSFVEYLQMSKNQTVYLLLECRHGSQTFADVTVCTAPKPVDTPPDYNPEYDNSDSSTPKRATQKGKNAVKKSASKKGKKITIKLKPNKGKLKKRTKKVYKNGTYGKLPKPTRKGYKFKGWYTKKSKGKRVTSKTKVSKRILYAHWKKKSKESKYFTVVYEKYRGPMVISDSWCVNYNVRKTRVKNAGYYEIVVLQNGKTRTKRQEYPEYGYSFSITNSVERSKSFDQFDDWYLPKPNEEFKIRHNVKKGDKIIVKLNVYKKEKNNTHKKIIKSFKRSFTIDKETMPTKYEQFKYWFVPYGSIVYTRTVIKPKN